MSETKHTPGPWKTSTMSPGYIFHGQQMLFAAPTVEEFRLGVANHPESEEHKANAMLVAAAPEMLQALKQLEAWLDSGVIVDGKEPTIAKSWARAAIAKATGQ